MDPVRRRDPAFFWSGRCLKTIHRAWFFYFGVRRAKGARIRGARGKPSYSASLNIMAVSIPISDSRCCLLKKNPRRLGSFRGLCDPNLSCLRLLAGTRTTHAADAGCVLVHIRLVGESFEQADISASCGFHLIQRTHVHFHFAVGTVHAVGVFVRGGLCEQSEGQQSRCGA